ncbi:MAG TPA: ClbS/DfsB family four-helix bundle protein [Ktedonobacteraceae bacterium]|jgi:hypothetical protein|nr:ClbS/DfsB family four-helix bundle protein [Ktedonobacteraceae bacterium]
MIHPDTISKSDACFPRFVSDCFSHKNQLCFGEGTIFVGDNLMPTEKQQFSRQELLAALEYGWKHYLSWLKELSEEEQARYAQKQGFARLQDVIVHIFGWWDLTMFRIYRIMSGHTVAVENDMDKINAELVARYKDWTREAVEEKFVAILTVFEDVLKVLPVKAFEDERISLWLRIDAIDHYEDHRLPNAPTLQEAGWKPE